MARQAQIRVDIQTGAIKVTDENGKAVKKLSRNEIKKLEDSRVKYIGTATVLQASPGITCIIIVIGGTVYKICM